MSSHPICLSTSVGLLGAVCRSVGVGKEEGAHVEDVCSGAAVCEATADTTWGTSRLLPLVAGISFPGVLLSVEEGMSKCCTSRSD